MNEVFIAYLIGRLDAISRFVSGWGGFLSFLTFASGAFWVFAYTVERDELKVLFIKCSKRCFWSLLTISVFLSFLLPFIPSSRQAVALYYGPKLLHNQRNAIKQLEVLPEKALRILNNTLDAQLEKEAPTTP